MSNNIMSSSLQRLYYIILFGFFQAAYLRSRSQAPDPWPSRDAAIGTSVRPSASLLVRAAHLPTQSGRRHFALEAGGSACSFGRWGQSTHPFLLNTCQTVNVILHVGIQQPVTQDASRYGGSANVISNVRCTIDLLPKDDQWCDSKNERLKALMPTIVSVGSLTEKLALMLKPQMKVFADKFKSLLPKKECGGGVLIEQVAGQAAQKESDWLSFSEAKDMCEMFGLDKCVS